MIVHPEVLVQLRDKLVADAEGFNAHRRQHKIIRFGEDVKVRRSPQAMAYRKRYVEELGRPRYAPARGKRRKQGIQTMRHGRGNPDTGLCWNLNDLMEL